MPVCSHILQPEALGKRKVKEYSSEFEMNFEIRDLTEVQIKSSEKGANRQRRQEML